jgi:signal transduction histidine kinase
VTVRWKLNTAFFALIGVFLAAAAVCIQAVSANANQTRNYVRMREMSQFTADVRTRLYAAVAARRDPSGALREVVPDDWSTDTNDDVNVQIMHAQSPRERQLWQEVHDGIDALGLALRDGTDAEPVRSIVKNTDRSLDELRRYYDITQFDSIAATAQTSFRAQVAIGLACGVTVLLFLLYLSMIRAWLVRPVETLKASAAAIGRGELDHRVPLEGRDELAELARRLEEMAHGLSAHQAALVEAREFSVIGEMCANVAHGLRNPLAALRSGAQLAARRCNGDAALRESFDALARQADVMDQRITRLFQFSRPLNLHLVPTRVRDVIETAKALARPVLADRGVDLVIDDQTGEAAWRIDREVLAEALGELITNAAYHSPPASRVLLEAKSTTGAENGGTASLQIDICDRGTGMAEATVNKCFAPFFTCRPGGSGMGLSLARRAIERHGGEIHLESAPGVGTTAHLKLPNAGAVHSEN